LNFGSLVNCSANCATATSHSSIKLYLPFSLSDSGSWIQALEL
jgi:hypothetical protein